MKQETLVAVFDTEKQADMAVVDLIRAGVLQSNIDRHAQAALDARAGPAPGPGQDSGFWSHLFGGETSHEQNAVYEQTTRSGGDVVTVLLLDGERDAEQVMTVLEKHSPVDVAERAATYGQVASITPLPILSEQTLQLSSERLAVGKRQVNRGAIRLRRFVQTKAVEQNVTLQDVTVVVDRRAAAANTPIASDAFMGGMIEMTETREEVVVSKRARVREELVLHKVISERVETIHENLRSEQVEVEHVPAVAKPNIAPNPGL